MSKTESLMIPLGTKAPSFELPDVVTGRTVAFGDVEQHVATVIMFICNHCPYVKHINRELVRLAQDYIPKNVLFLAISSNDVQAYPQDSPEHMKVTAREEQYPFSYLYDANQDVAKAYKAACTPDFYVFNQKLILTYRGQLDDSRPMNDLPVTGECIRLALDSIIQNQPLDIQQKPSIGCNIKWFPETS